MISLFQLLFYFEALLLSIYSDFLIQQPFYHYEIFISNNAPCFEVCSDIISEAYCLHGILFSILLVLLCVFVF